MISRGNIPFASTSIINLPDSYATSFFLLSVAPTVEEPIGEMPINSNTVAIVFAVYCAPHEPAPGHAASSS